MSEPAAGSLEQRLLTLYEQASPEEQAVLTGLFEMAARAEIDEEPLQAGADVDVEGFGPHRVAGGTGGEMTYVKVQQTVDQQQQVQQMARSILGSIWDPNVLKNIGK